MKRLRGLFLTIRSIRRWGVAALAGITLLGGTLVLGEGAAEASNAATSTTKACITTTLTWTYNASKPNADVPDSGPFVGRHNVGNSKLDVGVDISRQTAYFKSYSPYYLTAGEEWFANGQAFDFSNMFAYTTGLELSPGNTTIIKVLMRASTCAPGPPPPPPITTPIKLVATKAIIHANRASVKAGQRVVITGTITPNLGGGRTVVLQRSKGKGWVQIAQAKNNTKGMVTFRVSFTTAGKIRLRVDVLRDYPLFAAAISSVITESITS